MNVLLSVDRISKKYGTRTVLDNISFDVEKGSVFGILGPNGSGKTTILEIILGLNTPLSGNWRIFGEKLSTASLKRIGAVVEQPNFYAYLSGYQNLEIVAGIKDVPKHRIAEVLELVGLWERRFEKFKNFSFGMKQRLALASALVSDPELLILDEPTNGLDPQGISEIRVLMKKIAARGVTVVVTSHMLDEVEKVCTHLAVLKSGQLLFSGRIDEALTGEEFYEISSEKFNELIVAVSDMNDVKLIDTDTKKIVVELSNKLTITGLSNRLHKEGIVLSSIIHKKKTLESYFLDLTSEPR